MNLKENALTKIDFIGDIHGHANALEALLQKMGYHKKAGVYEHPERKAFFVGDYIDRGPQIPETLAIVKSMVDQGNAMALMGNHEYNALCFHLQNPKGGHLRKHSIKNILQYYETLRQFKGRQAEYEGYLDWFKTLPLYYEDDNFRAVHACWDTESLVYLRKTLVNDRLTDELIQQSAQKGSLLYETVEYVLKGKELQLLNGLSFTDPNGIERHRMRIKWWEDAQQMSYKSISVEGIEDLPETPVDHSLLPSTDYYTEQDKIVFFGHYWLRGKPLLHRANICCLDYSIAKGGNLVAYRFNGEEQLKEEGFVLV